MTRRRDMDDATDGWWMMMMIMIGSLDGLIGFGGRTSLTRLVCLSVCRLWQGKGKRSEAKLSKKYEFYNQESRITNN